MKTIKSLGYAIFWLGLFLISLLLGYLVGYILNVNLGVFLLLLGIVLGVGMMVLGFKLIDRGSYEIL